MTSPAPDTAFHLSNPAGLFDPAPYGFSHVAEIRTGARLVMISGQGGETADGGRPAEFRAQVRQAFRNLGVAARSVGGSLADVAKLTVLVVDHDAAKLAVFGEELQAALGDLMKPACTLIPVPRLALDDMLFEAEAVHPADNKRLEQRNWPRRLRPLAEKR